MNSEHFYAVNGDFIALNNWLESIEPPTRAGDYVSNELFMQFNGVQVQVVSLLEYYLKLTNFIKRPEKIKDIIKLSNLTQLEKDWIMLCVFGRHCIVHNGSFADDKFVRQAGKLGKLKTQFTRGSIVNLSKEELRGVLVFVNKLVEELDRKVN